jgi:hypothetical protein
MALHLTSCETTREPGFSRSECLELARQIESRKSVWDDLECGYLNCEGHLTRTEMSAREMATILAALRAYANG